MSQGWVGVDLDGTLAHYDGWRGPEHIGAPIPLMVERVQRWLAAGQEVRIFTARVSMRDPGERAQAVAVIQAWCQTHLGRSLAVTHEKDFFMRELWDDRCKQVLPNVGLDLESHLDRMTTLFEQLLQVVSAGRTP